MHLALPQLLMKVVYNLSPLCGHDGRVVIVMAKHRQSSVGEDGVEVVLRLWRSRLH